MALICKDNGPLEIPLLNHDFKLIKNLNYLKFIQNKVELVGTETIKSLFKIIQNDFWNLFRMIWNFLKSKQFGIDLKSKLFGIYLKSE